MDFELGEEQVMLKTSARDFLENECPKKMERDMMDDDKGYSPALWEQLANLGGRHRLFQFCAQVRNVHLPALPSPFCIGPRP